MLKYLALTAAAVFTLQAQALDDKTFDCRLSTDKNVTLSFTFSSERNVIIFNDLEKIPGLLVEGEYLGMIEGQTPRVISFEYDYYFTGRGTIEFDRESWQFKAGDQGQIIYNYDDGDGSGVENELYNCTVR
jgi:hypothetical protein